MQEWQCRWAPSLGKLENTHQEIWGTKEYENDTDPTVFFGLYGFPDFYALWRHKGEKHILWAGSDITHFKNGYWLDKVGFIKLNSGGLTRWINENCFNWVENEVEQDVLRKLGIGSVIRPSFLGRVQDYQISYKHSDRPKVYSSVSGDDFKLYRVEEIFKLADQNPGIEFYIYGTTKPVTWVAKYNNVVVRGWVPKEQMNSEIRQMQGALRLVKFDGFSEIIAKSLLWGQWPISVIPYTYVLPVKMLHTLKDMKEPNIKGREYYIKNLNDYPWAKQNI